MRHAIFFAMILSLAASAAQGEDVVLKEPAKADAGGTEEAITLKKPRAKAIAKPVVQKEAAKKSPRNAAAPAVGNSSITFDESIGSWRVFCMAKQRPTPCEMFQQAVVPSTRKPLVRMAVGYTPAHDSYMIELKVPLGVLIAKGVRLQTASWSSGRFQLRGCNLTGCSVSGPLDAAVVGALSRDNKGKALVTVWDENEKAVSFPLTLDGFADAAYRLVEVARAEVAAAP